MRNRTYYFFDDVININKIDPDKMNMKAKSYKIFCIYCIGMWRSKSLETEKLKV